MNPLYLVHCKTGSSYLFRSVVPFDLQPLRETKQFQLSLGCGILKQCKQLLFRLNMVAWPIYNSIREEPDMKKPIIRDILRNELEKYRRRVQHYYLGTNRFGITDRLKSVYTTKNNSDNN